MGWGAVISLFTKHKENAHSSNEAELIAMDDIIENIL